MRVCMHLEGKKNTQPPLRCTRTDVKKKRMCSRNNRNVDRERPFETEKWYMNTSCNAPTQSIHGCVVRGEWLAKKTKSKQLESVEHASRRATRRMQWRYRLIQRLAAPFVEQHTLCRTENFDLLYKFCNHRLSKHGRCEWSISVKWVACSENFHLN